MADQVSTELSTGREAAEERRERLRQLMDRLEAALAEPYRADRDAWRSRLSGLGDELDVEWRSHVAGTEGDDGLFDELIVAAPRLAAAVERVRDEHPAIQTDLARFRDAVEDGAEPDAIRRAGLALLTALIVHRQHGADLLYEAYWVDVGGLSGS